jgi:predicted  nucleic acid-binding Zn-ribbon protein
MMAKFDEALEDEVQISRVYSQRSIGYREQLLEVRDSFLGTEAGRALLDMKAKRDTELDLIFEAEEKIWDMEKTVRRLDSEFQEVKIQLKEERDKNHSKGGQTAAH